MAIKYGTDGEPGVISLVESDRSVGIFPESPADALLVGPADLTNGSATAGEVERVGRSSEARNKFGDSPLTDNLIDALEEGAFPMWGVAVESVDVTAEDLSGLSSNTGTLDEAPVEEDASTITFTINSSDLAVQLVDYVPEATDPGADEVYIEPTSGAFAIDDGITVGNTGDEADYTYHNYSDALNNATSGNVSDFVDMLGILTENTAVISEAEIDVEDMADEHRFSVIYAPERLDTDDLTNYDCPFDNSRVTLIYPGRDEGDHIIGAYTGLRSRLGIRTTPIRERLITHDSVDERLTKSDRIALIDNRVVPMQDDPVGVKIIDDINTVDYETNEDERFIRFGYTRLVADYLIRTIQVNEEDFIGDLNNPATRGAMKASIQSSLGELKERSQVIDFQVNVSAESATKASVEVGLDLADPLRNVENTITIGE